MLNLEPLIKIIGNDEKSLNSLINTFLKTTKEDIRNLESAVNNRQDKLVREIAHRIKGGAAIIGAETLATLADSMESSGLNRKVDQYDSTIQSIKSQFEAIESLYGQ